MGGGLTNKGFTLIELLAIIVILAIIAVITVPIILNIIENSKKGAAQDSAYGYKDSINKYYVDALSENKNLKLEGEYTVSDGNLTGKFEGPESTSKTVTILVSGEKTSSGKLRYSNSVLNGGCVVIGDFKITFDTDGKVNGTTKGDCEGYEFSVVSNKTQITEDVRNYNKISCLMQEPYEWGYVDSINDCTSNWEIPLYLLEDDSNLKYAVCISSYDPDSENYNGFTGENFTCIDLGKSDEYLATKITQLNEKGLNLLPEGMSLYILGIEDNNLIQFSDSYGTLFQANANGLISYYAT